MTFLRRPFPELATRRSAVVLVLLGLTAVGWGAAPEIGRDATVPADPPANRYTTQPARIYVDGEGDDWSSLSVRHTDAGDGTGVGIERLWTAHTDRFLFLRLELSRPVNLQEDNALTLYLDTDDDATTGTEALGLGAELAWTFGERSGRFGGTEIQHADLALTSLPTVRSDVFEIALDRSARPDGSSSLFRNDSLRIALSSGGDRLPDRDGGLGYVLSESETTMEAPSIDRPAAAVRLASYNVVNNFERDLNALFIDEKQGSLRRIFGAIDADVLGFQEVYDQTARETERAAEGELGLPSEWEWAKEGRDLVLGSRFPILDIHEIPGYEDYRSGAFLLDAREALGRRLVVVLMHPPCCNTEAEDGAPSSDAQRQRVADGVAAFMRTLKTGTGPFDVAPETPVVILGDMNFVGASQQRRTLRTGAIVNEEAFGPSAAPDWDGSALLDTNPRQAGSPMHVTWIDADSSFPPSRLDYAFVTDSVLDVLHEFVLYTPALSDDVLQTHGLQAGDTDTASDHLPVVVDVRPR